MSSKLREYAASASNYTLVAPTGENEVMVRNSSAGAIIVSPPAGHTFTGNVASISVPASGSVLCRPLWPTPVWTARLGP